MSPVIFFHTFTYTSRQAHCHSVTTDRRSFIFPANQLCTATKFPNQWPQLFRMLHII